MPIKTEQIKWDGQDENGRFKNVGGYKYDVINKTSVIKYEPLPKYFLADNPKEAEELYEEFSNLLNSISYTYAVSSGLNKSDLFGEALIGLARARRDWDSSRSSDFKTYAIYRIRDNLNEYVRINANSVVVPSYIRKANLLINKLKDSLASENIEADEILFYGKLPENTVSDRVKESAQYCIDKLKNAAERANISLERLVERAEFIPLDVSELDKEESGHNWQEENRIHAKIIVERLQKFMNDDEVAICNGIMNDNSYDEIGKELGKSGAWVGLQIKKLRTKLILKLKEGEV